MPVTKEELAQYVSELGLPQEQTDGIITTLMANQQAATQFVGQRLRHSDYTKKTQELANHKQGIEAQATEQITAYATELSNAQKRIDNIMRDLETEKISSTTANARLRTVKEKFNLSDDDIPALEVKTPAGTGGAPGTQAGGGIDIDAKLRSFGDNLLKTIRQDMLAMPRVTAIQADIAEQHKDLTGKRITRAEMEELLATANKDKISLESAWADKYKVNDLRQTKRDEENKTKWEQEWEAKRRAKASEDALAGVRHVDSTQESHNSPVIGRKFNEHADPARPVADKSVPVTQTQTGVKVSGAERAAAKFLERRSLGLPMGAPQQKTA